MVLSFAFVLVFAGSAFARENVIVNSSVEWDSPFFWSEEAMGGDLIWATDEAEQGLRSLKIAKTTTGTAASWKSFNHAQTFWNHMEAVLYTVSFYGKTDGVNTSPANDDASIGTIWTFFDDNGSAIGDPVFVAVDQSAATSDWTEYTAQVALDAVPAEAYCEAIMGSDATGTVWFDHFNYASDPWTGGFFGGGCEDPEGWMAWYSTGDVGFAAVVEDETAHSGNHSVKLEENDDLGDEMVFYTMPYAAEASTDYIVGVWVKYDDLNTNEMYYPTEQIGENLSDRANLCFFFHTGDIAHEWTLTGGDQFLYFDQRTAGSGEWVKYWTIVTSPEDATGISMRARFNPTVTGTVYYDDFFCYPVDRGENIVMNSDLETVAPFSWSENQDDGTLTWAEDEAHEGIRSLKIEKDGTGAASWLSGNNAQTYWNHMEAVLYTLSFWAKTDGVNTAPANEDAQIGTYWTFKDDEGNVIGSPIFIGIDQSSATMDWTEFTAQVALEEVPAEAYCEAVMNTDATGTVWFDDFNNSSDPWTAGFFNGNCETPAYCMSWASSGDVGFANTVDVGEDAHSGSVVAKLIENDDLGDEMVFYTVPFAVEAGEWYEFSVWTKSIGMSPLNPMYYPSNVMTENVSQRANLCFFFHAGDMEHEWTLTGGDKFIYLQQIEEDEDWTLYRGVAMAPEDATGASMRARFNPTVQGEVWFDDFSIVPLDQENVSVDPGTEPVALVPNAIQLHQNYPNPFNAMTNIAYTLPNTGHVQLSVYDLLGREVMRLVDNVQVAGDHKISFDGRQFASGAYFYRLSTEGISVTRKMMFLK